ncbi:pistil-specific extensin-like protein [Triticum urartu]|uniref:pistil-specific extensin-like protein n=1 Tax=Triticum urartu TaxID=4572 RepID=UPI002044701D|nr:pistil-specific extensin-like protein [Triticum urartu]
MVEPSVPHLPPARNRSPVLRRRPHAGFPSRALARPLSPPPARWPVRCRPRPPAGCSSRSSAAARSFPRPAGVCRPLARPRKLLPPIRRPPPPASLPETARLAAVDPPVVVPPSAGHPHRPRPSPPIRCPYPAEEDQVVFFSLMYSSLLSLKKRRGWRKKTEILAVGLWICVL